MNLMMGIFFVLVFPFLGTALGAACVLLWRGRMSENLQKMQMGLAGGVMTAASVWSLLLPAIDMCGEWGKLRFVKALIGFGLGVAFLYGIDRLIPRLRRDRILKDKTAMLMMAVTLHNIPEGAACGAVLAGALSRESPVTMIAAIMLALGIGIQNFPEGAIISLPYRAEGKSRFQAFGMGVLSGAVEPLAAMLTVLLAGIVTPLLPYMLAFAAAAMIYVTVEELIPEMAGGRTAHIGTLAFAAGFAVMMVLDVALG